MKVIILHPNIVTIEGKLPLGECEVPDDLGAKLIARKLADPIDVVKSAKPEPVKATTVNADSSDEKAKAKAAAKAAVKLAAKAGASPAKK